MLLPALSHGTIFTVANAEMRMVAQAGDYGSVSEVVRDAQRDWHLRRKSETLEIDELRHLVQQGIDSGPSLEADSVFATLRARFADPCDKFGSGKPWDRPRGPL